MNNLHNGANIMFNIMYVGQCDKILTKNINEALTD